MGAIRINFGERDGGRPVSVPIYRRMAFGVEAEDSRLLRTMGGTPKPSCDSIKYRRDFRHDAGAFVARPRRAGRADCLGRARRWKAGPEGQPVRTGCIRRWPPPASRLRI